MVKKIEEPAAISMEHTSSKDGIPGILKNLLSKFNTDDFLLLAILFLLVDEGIDDEFLILAIILLLLTE